MDLPPELAGIRAIAFDLDGTLYQDGGPLPDAVETVAAVRDAGMPVRFLTNTTSRSRSSIARKLERLGFPCDEEEVFSPPFAAGEFLRSQGASAHLVVQPAAREDFAGVPEDDAHPDLVVVGDLGEDWTFERLNRAFRLLAERGAQLIGLGRTAYWQAPGGLQLDAGTFVAALEYASGQQARVFGKPERAFFLEIVKSLDCSADQVALVGDDIRTDVGAAMAAGLRGVLVRTGKFREGDLERGITPDLVLGSVAGLLEPGT